MEAQMDSKDVVRLVVQFLQEHNLGRSAAVVQEESGVGVVERRRAELAAGAVQEGRWAAVLEASSGLRLPRATHRRLLRMLVRVLLHAREEETARAVAGRLVASMGGEASVQAEVRAAEQLGGVQEAERRQMADEVRQAGRQVGQARLVGLLAGGLRMQALQEGMPGREGKDKEDTEGKDAEGKDGEEGVGSRNVLLGVGRRVRREAGACRTGPRLAFVQEARVLCWAWRQDGQAGAAGGSDGLVEVVGPSLKALPRAALPRHRAAVLALAFSPCGQLLASGDAAGCVKVWQVESGRCVARLPAAHEKGVTCLAFSPASSARLLSASFDGTAREHGLTSRSTLAVLRGHASFVNHCAYLPGARIATASSDGRLRIFSSAHVLEAEVELPGRWQGRSVRQVHVCPQQAAAPLLLAVLHAPVLLLLALDGTLVRTLAPDDASDDFVAACVSPQASFAYGLTAGGSLVRFGLASGEVEEVTQAHERDGLGISHHPHRSQVVTFAKESPLKLWKPRRKA